jgi:hypothetical protein
MIFAKEIEDQIKDLVLIEIDKELDFTPPTNQSIEETLAIWKELEHLLSIPDLTIEIDVDISGGTSMILDNQGKTVWVSVLNNCKAAVVASTYDTEFEVKWHEMYSSDSPIRITNFLLGV